MPCAYKDTIVQQANSSVQSHTNKKLFSDNCEITEKIAKIYKSDKHAEKQKHIELF